MYTEDQLLPLSALQHLVYCERRCALVHIERVWAENPFTLAGTHLHQRVDDSSAAESRGDVRIVRGLYLRCLRLGLSGRADVVQFHRIGDPDVPGQGLPDAETPACAAPLAEHRLPYPVDYKRGELKRERGYEIQLCAQALCLEEMLSVSVPRGALFYAASGRRMEVEFVDALRGETIHAAARLHELIEGGITPPGVRQPKCSGCSMIELCMPASTKTRRSAVEYVRSEMARDEEV